MSFTADGDYVTEVDDPESVDCPECQGLGLIQYGWGRHKRTETCERCDGEGAVEVVD